MVSPKVKLVGKDGNRFSILVECRTAARKAGWTTQEFNDFRIQAIAGDFNELLRTVQLYFEVE